MIVVNGIKWRFCFVPPYHSVLLTPGNNFALACCDDITKTVYVSDSVPSYKLRQVLCHEIVHIYMYSYNVNLTLKQEEQIAEIMTLYGERILATTNMIYNRYNSSR